MAIQIRETVLIGRPLKDVAGFLVNLENEVHYWEGVRSVRLVSGSHGKPGARYARTFEAKGRTQTTTLEVVEHTPNARLVVESGPGPVAVRGTLWFEALPEGTKVNLTLEAHARGFARLFAGRIGQGMLENTRASLGRLKAHLESAGGAAPGKLHRPA